MSDCLSAGLTNSYRPRPMPMLVKSAFAVDILLVAAFLLGEAVHLPYSRMIDLNREANIPTYYSSIQLLSVGVVLGLVAFVQPRRSVWRTLQVWALPAVFALLSLDEVAGIHELLGHIADQLLHHDRATSIFWNTGIWMFLLGVPFVLGVAAAIWFVRDLFRCSPGCLLRVGIGFAAFLGGALGVEGASNALAVGTSEDDPVMLRLIALEEGLEMIGVTILLWAALDLLAAHRIGVRVYRAGGGTEPGRMT